MASETIMPVMSLLGVAFSFASKDLGTRVRRLKKASREHATLQGLVRADEARGLKWEKGSNTRMVQGCFTAGSFIYTLFAKLAADDSLLLYTAAREAYEEVFEGLHTWSVRQAVLLGLRSLPTRQVFLAKVAGGSERGRAEAISARFADSWGPLEAALSEMVADAP